MKRFVRTALAVGLALASGTAAALGLGQIELKSKLGEPLLAEIPIISNDPAELERLRAGLASPETFARIGLRPPDSVVANLQFVSALDEHGNPVIRVTSVQPIEQPLLTFLVEVDWGQGKLVREYSTLIDAPRTVSAPLQPPIEAPVAAPSNIIASEPAAITGASETGVADALESPSDPAGSGQSSEAVPDTAIEPTPEPAAAPRPVASTQPPPVPAARPGEYGAVRAGETLSEIAERLDFGTSLDQAMIALLDANPDAFIDGNVNLLKQGAVLRVPEAAEVRSVDVAEAMARVREQTSTWRTARAPVPQPALAEDSPDATANAGSTAENSPGAPVTAAGGARLEIVPPGASSASQAGTQSGISAGAEGDMVRQEMQQTQETLAARNAELADLKSRVADLEKLQADQQKLLQMKDNELTAVQQRLAETRAAGQDAGAPGLPWLLGGAGLLVLGLLGGWWMRRRAEVDAGGFRAPVSPDNPSPLAAGFPAAKPVAAPRREPVMPDPAPERETLAAAPAAPVAPVVAAAPIPTAPAPTWHAGSPKLNVPAPVATEPSMADTDAPGRERLELARAYLDLGDRDSARQLLGEIAINGDHALRQQATQMLRELD